MSMGLRPIRHPRLYERILEQILTLIRNGEWKPGEKMPTAKELAEQLGVGQSSVREAMSALKAMGLVEIRHGEGAFVRETQGDTTIQPLAMLLLMERDRALEAMEVRRFLEVGAAGLAAKNRTSEHLARIRKALEEMENDCRNERLGDETDWQFHYAIVEATGNSFLLRLINTISDSLQTLLRYNRERMFAEPGMGERLHMEHTAIYEAIAAGDSPLAEQRMDAHLSGVETWLRQSFANDRVLAENRKKTTTE
jgi:GntR family transcriptional regulator, transcriptional repressor for pyruvate dehydrogenase complex